MVALKFDFIGISFQKQTTHNLDTGMAHERDYENWFSKYFLAQISNIKFH